MRSDKWLSVLVCGIPDRRNPPVLDKLLKQTEALSEVELLYLLDNRSMGVGEKRNTLLGAAIGDYLTFVDDDDDIADDYIDSILDALEDCNDDVVVFNQIAILMHTGVRHFCTYSIKHVNRTPRRAMLPRHGNNIYGDIDWSGPPAHTMVWRSELAKSEVFPPENFGEDAAWCDLVSAKAKSERRIDKTLYFYLFDPDKSRTRGL